MVFLFMGKHLKVGDARAAGSKLANSITVITNDQLMYNICLVWDCHRQLYH